MPYFETKKGTKIKRPKVCLHPALCTCRKVGACSQHFTQVWEFFQYVNWYENEFNDKILS